MHVKCKFIQKGKKACYVIFLSRTVFWNENYIENINRRKSFQRENWRQLRGIPNNLRHLRLAPAQFSDPRNVHPRHLRHQHIEKKGPEGQGPRPWRQQAKAKRQRGNEKKEERHPWGFNWKKAATISILSVPQIVYLDLFLCWTLRHNQYEPHWIVAQRLLSALTMLEVFESYAKEFSF